MNGGGAAAGWSSLSANRQRVCARARVHVRNGWKAAAGAPSPAGAAQKNYSFFITDHKKGHDSILW